MQWHRTRISASISITLLLLAAGCNTNRDAAGPRSGKLQSIATFSVIGDLVRNVAGDQADIVTLVGADGAGADFV